jgi:hypothetical protein
LCADPEGFSCRTSDQPEGGEIVNVPDERDPRIWAYNTSPDATPLGLLIAMDVPGPPGAAVALDSKTIAISS